MGILSPYLMFNWIRPAIPSIRSTVKPGELLLRLVACEGVLCIFQTIVQLCLGGSQIAFELVNLRQEKVQRRELVIHIQPFGLERSGFGVAHLIEIEERNCADEIRKPLALQAQ